MAVFVLDLANDGYQFASVDEGVTFDIDGTGTPVRIGWTKAGADDGFLFLDTNDNGRVDSGRELIGNGWRKPDGSRVLSGDHALSVIQGVVDPIPEGPVSRDLEHLAFVDANDDVFTRLRLWRDSNHNGQSEAGELRTLAQVNVLRIFIGFANAKRTADPSGNMRLMDGTFYLQPAADCRPQPGISCRVQRRMVHVEFARKR